MSTRKDLLVQLLARTRPVERILDELAEFGWDSDRDLVVLTREHLKTALQEFRDGGLSAADAQSWAEALEAREDIGFEAGHEETLKCVIFALANLTVGEPLSVQTATRVIQQLSKYSMDDGHAGSRYDDERQ